MKTLERSGAKSEGRRVEGSGLRFPHISRKLTVTEKNFYLYLWESLDNSSLYVSSVGPRELGRNLDWGWDFMVGNRKRIETEGWSTTSFINQDCSREASVSFYYSFYFFYYNHSPSTTRVSVSTV